MKKNTFSLILLLCVFVLQLAAEPYRPMYHHTPGTNWMNDPNGMFYDDATGVWHLYYQHNPYATTWGNMTWAHSTSTDLIHWQPQPLAILPDSLGTIFSGSAVIDKDNTAGFGKGAIVAIFTYSERFPQSQAIAYSTDGGQTFTKYEGNPVLKGNVRDFRDPKVWRDADGWKMVLAVGQEVQFFRSDNLKEWTYLSSFGKGYGCHNDVWECPDLLRFDKKDVLVVNNGGGVNGGSATQYFVGNWDGTAFTIDPSQNTQTYWMDYGKDHYATVSFFNAPNQRQVVMAWMNNWQYGERVPTIAYRSQNSIARDVKLMQHKDGSYFLNVQPSPEYQQLDIPTYKLNYKGKALQQELNKEEMVERIHIKLTKVNKPIQMVLSNVKGEQVILSVDPQKQTFSMDRHESGLVDFHPAFPATTVAPLPEDKQLDILIYVDHCSMELFLNDGEIAMTNLVFPTQPYTHLSIQ